MIQRILACSLVLMSLASCASGQRIVNVACPKPPIILRVEVKNKTITGKDVDHAIENNQRLWSHIHLLEKLGCKIK